MDTFIYEGIEYPLSLWNAVIQEVVNWTEISLYWPDLLSPHFRAHLREYAIGNDVTDEELDKLLTALYRAATRQGRSFPWPK